MVDHLGFVLRLLVLERLQAWNQQGGISRGVSGLRVLVALCKAQRQGVVAAHYHRGAPFFWHLWWTSALGDVVVSRLQAG